VLLTFEDYTRLTGEGANIIDLLGSPEGVEDADLESPLLRDPARPVDLG
jgi:hypothetical protein